MSCAPQAVRGRYGSECGNGGFLLKLSHSLLESTEEPVQIGTWVACAIGSYRKHDFSAAVREKPTAPQLLDPISDREFESPVGCRRLAAFRPYFFLRLAAFAASFAALASAFCFSCISRPMSSISCAPWASTVRCNCTRVVITMLFRTRSTGVLIHL